MIESENWVWSDKIFLNLIGNYWPGDDNEHECPVGTYSDSGAACKQMRFWFTFTLH